MSTSASARPRPARTTLVNNCAIGLKVIITEATINQCDSDDVVTVVVSHGNLIPVRSVVAWSRVILPVPRSGGNGLRESEHHGYGFSICETRYVELEETMRECNVRWLGCD